MPELQGCYQKAGDDMAKGKRKNAWINSPQADAVAAYYVDGHSVADTAEHFGVSKCQVNNLAKARRLTNGRQFQQSRVDDQKREAEQHLAKQLLKIGFEYVGGYSDKHGKAIIKCCKCGAEIERTIDHLQRGNVICRECQKREAEEQKQKRKQITAQELEVHKIEREWSRLMHPPKDYYAEIHKAFLDRAGICEICGKPYTVREYVESCGIKYAVDNGVCSLECRKEKLRRAKRIRRRVHKEKRTENHCRRARKYGAAYDASITLKKLIVVKGLRCAICGGMCDLNDHSWTDYAGPTYPSIDHIIPMSKGGSHTWDNVQVAHIICNSRKGDKIEEAMI